jgi:hypothetical protein
MRIGVVKTGDVGFNAYTACLFAYRKRLARRVAGIGFRFVHTVTAMCPPIFGILLGTAGFLRLAAEARECDCSHHVQDRGHGAALAHPETSEDGS